jgi:HlyD family secretion protein
MKLRLFLILLVGLALAGCGAGSQPTALPTVVIDAGGTKPAPTAAALPTATQPGGSDPAAQAVPTQPAVDTAPVLPAQSGVVTASAEIAPAQTVDLSFAAPCLVQGLVVTEGDAVRAGELLASQDNVAQLQSALEAGRQALVSAQKDYDHLLENVPVERAAAQLALVQAQKTLEDAQKTSRSKQFQRASQEVIDIARARLIQANEALSDAESLFGSVSARNNQDVEYAAGLTALAKARQDQVRAQYNLNYVMGLPSPLDIEEANANVALAQANVLAAKQAWENVKNGDPGEQAAAAVLARITAAQASLDAAQLSIDRSVLRAPFDGTVIAVPVISGQAVNPGQVVLTIANLNNLQVETTDLSERDINRVSVGHPARVTVEGLGQTFEGKVIKIAPRSTKVGGDVVYKVTIQLNGQPAGLRWGMSATVQIGQ